MNRHSLFLVIASSIFSTFCPYLAASLPVTLASSQAVAGCLAVADVKMQAEPQKLNTAQTACTLNPAYRKLSNAFQKKSSNGIDLKQWNEIALSLPNAAVFGSKAKVSDNKDSIQCIAWHDNFTFMSDLVACAVHPKGTHIAFTEAPDVVKIVNRENNAVEKTLAHTRFVYAIAWSPDGTRIATGDKDGNVNIWDAATGKKEREFSKEREFNNQYHTASAQSLSWHPDSRSLAWASGSGKNYMIKIGSVITGQKKQIPDKNSIDTVNWNSQGTEIVTISSDDGIACVWNVADGKKQREFRTDDWVDIEDESGGRSFVFAAFRPHTDTVALGGIRFGIGTIYLAHSVTGQIDLELQSSSKGSLLSGEWNPQGSHIATGDRHGKLQIWDIASITDPAYQKAFKEMIEGSLNPEQLVLITTLHEAAQKHKEAQKAQKEEAEKKPFTLLDTSKNTGIPMRDFVTILRSLHNGIQNGLINHYTISDANDMIIAVDTADRMHVAEEVQQLPPQAHFIIEEYLVAPYPANTALDTNSSVAPMKLLTQEEQDSQQNEALKKYSNQSEALFNAVKSKSLEQVKKCINPRILNARDENYKTVLIAAVGAQATDIIDYVLGYSEPVQRSEYYTEQIPVNAAAVDQFGNTALLVALSNQDYTNALKIAHYMQRNPSMHDAFKIENEIRGEKINAFSSIQKAHEQNKDDATVAQLHALMQQFKLP